MRIRACEPSRSLAISQQVLALYHWYSAALWVDGCHSFARSFELVELIELEQSVEQIGR